MHLPIGGEERADIVRREKIRRAVRTVEHADLPIMREARLQFDGESGRLRIGGGFLADMQHVAGAERAPAMTAKLAERESRAAAEIFRHVDAAAHGDIGARAWAGDTAELQHLACPDGERPPVGYRLAIECRGELGAAKTEECVAVELERRARQRRLDACGILVVADKTICEPEGQRIHRA